MCLGNEISGMILKCNPPGKHCCGSKGLCLFPPGHPHSQAAPGLGRDCVQGALSPSPLLTRTNPITHPWKSGFPALWIRLLPLLGALISGISAGKSAALGSWSTGDTGGWKPPPMAAAAPAEHGSGCSSCAAHLLSHTHTVVLEALLPGNWRRCGAAKAENTQLLWQVQCCTENTKSWRGLGW